MLQRLAVGRPTVGRGSLPANAGAYFPVVRNMHAATYGAVSRTQVGVLSSVRYQPYPQAVPPGPIPRQGQRSWAHGPWSGGAYFVQYPPPKVFGLFQKEVLPAPLAQVASPGMKTSMTTARPGRTQHLKARMGGQWVTASPLVVPRWPVITGQAPPKGS